MRLFWLTIGSFLLTVELFFAFLLTLGAFPPTILLFSLTLGAFFAYNGKVRLIRVKGL